MKKPRQLSIYKLDVDYDSDDLTGLSVISMVSEPAIERSFQMFNDSQKFKFEVTDATRRIVSGPALIPEMLIFRADETGEYYVKFDAVGIEKMAQKYMKTFKLNNSSFQHNGDLLNGVYMFESYVIDRTRGNVPNSRYSDLPDGSWFVSFRIDNDEVWELAKSGLFTGFSIEGVFNHIATGESYMYKG